MNGSSTGEIARVGKEFSQEFEILTLLTSEMKLATLYELQTKYDVQDLYDMLEILDVHGTIVEEQHRKSLPKDNK